MGSDISELSYLEEPGEDYPTVLRVKTHGRMGMLRLRELLERLAAGESTSVDLLAELPAVSQTVARCMWHAVERPVERSVTLMRMPDGHLSVDWYAGSSMWRELLSVFEDYLAHMDQPVVDRSGVIVSAGPRIACLYADPDTDYDAVFEAEP